LSDLVMFPVSLIRSWCVRVLLKVHDNNRLCAMCFQLQDRLLLTHYFRLVSIVVKRWNFMSSALLMVDFLRKSHPRVDSENETTATTDCLILQKEAPGKINQSSKHMNIIIVTDNSFVQITSNSYNNPHAFIFDDMSA
jgi:hypothetical protein